MRELLEEAKQHRLTDPSEQETDDDTAGGGPGPGPGGGRVQRRTSVQRITERYDKMYQNLTRANSSARHLTKGGLGEAHTRGDRCTLLSPYLAPI